LQSQAARASSPKLRRAADHIVELAQAEAEEFGDCSKFSNGGK
jgi:hypothetical protein